VTAHHVQQLAIPSEISPHQEPIS